MTLTQRGPKVTGAGRWRATTMTFEGIVRGDVLKFSRPEGLLRGEVIVAGDEMSGIVIFGPATRTLRLQRQP